MSKIVFFWDNFGPLHVDRCEAVAARLGNTHQVIGLELASKSNVYGWVPEGGSQFRKITLVSGKGMEDIPWKTRFNKVLRACLSMGRDTKFFMCHYNDSAVLAVSTALRLLGRRVYTMGCSKFDDYERSLRRELFKSIFLIPYHGAIGSGLRSRDYLRFMGLQASHVKSPYNAVSMDRIRALAGAPAAPEGVPFADRDFALVARLIPKKNISMALKAMMLYAQQVASPRHLHIFGNGPLEAGLREQAKQDGIGEIVHFHGFLQTAEISKGFASSLALLLPSIEEQFGNVVPEALAMGLPIILSDNCGARDLLVRSGVNGFVIESDNPEGMAYFMRLLSEDEQLWNRMCLASRQFSEQADSPRFAEAVQELIAN
jgi:glycosyltransferase involved in cell wall biosynthesis